MKYSWFTNFTGEITKPSLSQEFSYFPVFQRQWLLSRRGKYIYYEVQIILLSCTFLFMLLSDTDSL